MSDNEATSRQPASGRWATVVVLAALAGIAWWGHRTGWRAPRFADLFGAAAAHEKEDWCDAHNVPDSKCVACHPELTGSDPKDWCKEHGVPESQCTVCHPELLTKGKADDWCKEHGVPESQCTVCHPEIAVRGEAPPSSTGAVVTPEPGAPAQPDPTLCKLHAVRVQFASAAAVAKAGVHLAAVQARPMAASVAAPGEVEYDATLVARLSPPAAGTVRRVDAEIGRAVKRGDVLALVDAADVGRAKADLLRAVASVRQRTLLAEGAHALVDAGEQALALAGAALARTEASAKDGFRTRSDADDANARVAEARIQLAERRAAAADADAAVAEARLERAAAEQVLANLGLPVRADDLAGTDDEIARRLRLLGIPDAAGAGLDPAAASANLVPVVAPFDGVVIARESTAGEHVDAGAAMFVVADVRRMWLVLDVRQEDASAVALGQAVVFRPDGRREDAVAGTVAWVGTEADERTRTVKVRAEVENGDGRLRAHTFGSGRVVVRAAPSATAVPNEAVHWEGCCHVVFVRLTDEVFQTRKVRLGARDAEFTEVLAGVLPGEVVATEGSHVLKSELLKSQLGAGCCDD